MIRIAIFYILYVELLYGIVFLLGKMNNIREIRFYGGVNMVLLVVDTQKAITNSELYQFEVFEKNVKELIHRARKNNIEVIFVRHDDGVGNELTKGNECFEIYDGFRPMDDEIIFDKNVNSSFRDAGLLEYLREKDNYYCRFTNGLLYRCNYQSRL